MLEAKLHLNALGEERRQFIGESGSGHHVVMDDAQGNSGPKPIELALLALGGCTAFDVVSILRKMRQRVTSYEVDLSAEQRTEPPCVFTRVIIKHRLHGQIAPQAAQKAIHLSETKYCSVEAMIGKTAEITNTFEIIPENDLAPEDSNDPSLIAPMLS